MTHIAPTYSTAQETAMQLLQASFCDHERAFKVWAKKKAVSIGTKSITMAANIRSWEPEYHIMRERDAKTADSSLAITLP